MSPAFLAMLLALAVAPAIAYLVYSLARGLGFLDPPVDKQHEHRRAIIIALYALLVFLPVLLQGFEKRWPPAWILFGFASGAALVVFAAVGIRAAIALWKLRHPDIPEPRSESSLKTED